jgi:5-methylcytosine-specific restriction endonuclease McrA
MKRSGFTNKPRKPLKRSPLKANPSRHKPKTTPKSKVKAKKDTKPVSLKKLRDKADSLLTPLCKKISPNCEACNQPTQVGHHWIEKSRSSFLRYDMRNLIALCNPCHAKIHNRFGNSVVGGLDVAEIIIKKRGRAWKNQLDKDQQIHQAVNKSFYIENHNRLKELYEI